MQTSKSFSPGEKLVGVQVWGRQQHQLSQLHSLLIVSVRTGFAKVLISQHLFQYGWLSRHSILLLNRETGALSSMALDVHGRSRSSQRLLIDKDPSASSGRGLFMFSRVLGTTVLLQARAGQRIDLAELTFSVHGPNLQQRSSTAVSVPLPGVFPSDQAVYSTVCVSERAVAALCRSQRPQAPCHVHVFELHRCSMAVGRHLFSIQGCQGTLQFCRGGLFVAVTRASLGDVCVLDAFTGACLQRLHAQDYCTSLSGSQAERVTPWRVAWAGSCSSAELHITSSVRLPSNEHHCVLFSVIHLKPADRSAASSPAQGRWGRPRVPMSIVCLALAVLSNRLTSRLLQHLDS